MTLLIVSCTVVIAALMTSTTIQLHKQGKKIKKELDDNQSKRFTELDNMLSALFKTADNTIKQHMDDANNNLHELRAALRESIKNNELKLVAIREDIQSRLSSEINSLKSLTGEQNKTAQGLHENMLKELDAITVQLKSMESNGANQLNKTAEALRNQLADVKKQTDNIASHQERAEKIGLEIQTGLKDIANTQKSNSTSILNELKQAKDELLHASQSANSNLNSIGQGIESLLHAGNEQLLATLNSKSSSMSTLLANTMEAIKTLSTTITTGNGQQTELLRQLELKLIESLKHVSDELTRGISDNAMALNEMATSANEKIVKKMESSTRDIGEKYAETRQELNKWFKGMQEEMTSSQGDTKRHIDDIIQSFKQLNAQLQQQTNQANTTQTNRHNSLLEATSGLSSQLKTLENVIKDVHEASDLELKKQMKPISSEASQYHAQTEKSLSKLLAAQDKTASKEQLETLFENIAEKNKENADALLDQLSEIRRCTTQFNHLYAQSIFRDHRTQRYSKTETKDTITKTFSQAGLEKITDSSNGTEIQYSYNSDGTVTAETTVNGVLRYKVIHSEFGAPIEGWGYSADRKIIEHYVYNDEGQVINKMT